jgi:hypothetical protein
MNIRPFDWRDISLLRNYLERGVFLDSAQILTRGSSLIPMGAFLSFMGSSTRTYTYRSEITAGSGEPLLGQLSYAAGSSYAKFTFLAPENSLEQPEVSEFSDFLAIQVGEMGGFHILADVDECSHVFELLHRAGFAIYARQRIWRLEGQSLSAGDSAAWISIRSKDTIAVRSLYCNVVPGLVQQVEPLPKKGVKGRVYYNNADILAFAEIKSGRIGTWIQPFINPDADDIEQFLVPLMQELQARRNRPLYICIRSYQSWLESALEAIGAQPGPSQAVMVRHLTVARPVNQAYSVAAINGKRVEPTAPIVQIDGNHYVEAAKVEKNS